MFLSDPMQANSEEGDSEGDSGGIAFSDPLGMAGMFLCSRIYLAVFL